MIPDPRYTGTNLRCLYTGRFLHLVQAALSQLSEQPTKSQVQAVKQLVERLYQSLAADAQADPMHYASSGGVIHTCVQDIYADIECYFFSRISLTPEPLPAPAPPPPPPRPQPLSDEEQLAFVERWIRENSHQTFFGNGAEGGQHDTGTPRP
jgi:hypothetical protein